MTIKVFEADVLAFMEKQASKLMEQGVYNPADLFDTLYARFEVDYRLVREAIHRAKSGA